MNDAPNESAVHERAHSWRWLKRLARRVGPLLVVALIVEYLLVPQLAGTKHWLHLLEQINPWWVLSGLAAELGSLLAFSLATRVLLPQEGVRPPLGRLWRIDLAGIALSHSVPGGAAAGTALSYQQLHRSGVSASAASFAKLGQGAVSALVLQALLVSSIAIAIPFHGTSPLYLTAVLGGAGVLLAAGLLIVAVLRAEAKVAAVAGALTAHLPRMDADTGRRFVRSITAQLRLVARQPRLLALSSAWSAANWLLDALALWFSVLAFGHVLGYDGLLVPYCVANVAAWIPLTPSGLGIVEGVIVPLLVGFGTPRGAALLGTITWRLLNFWLPIPLGAVSYLSLTTGAVDKHASDPEAEIEPEIEADPG